jgi:hypothetical protein
MLKARCLPVLPKLVDALLVFLAEASKLQPTGSEQNQNKLVQVSMLRAMTSVAEHLPQFLIPHLDKVLSPAVLPSFTIDEIDLVATLAETVPSRQLLPAPGRALKKCSHASEISVLLKLTKASVEQTSRGEIGAVIGHVLQSILHSCDFDTSLMEVANQVLLSLVMKLTEAQLRPVYRIGKLDLRSQVIFKIAGCLGSQFTVDVLNVICCNITGERVGVDAEVEVVMSVTPDTVRSRETNFDKRR